MRTVFIPMQPDNVDRILSGKKTTTIRSETAFNLIGLKVGETGTCSFGGRRYKVTCRGGMSVHQAGGAEAIIKSEGYDSIADVKYKQTLQWLEGRNNLYVYDIVPMQSAYPISPLPR